MIARYDVIVIGVGGMGSAAVYELAKRGKRVLGLERFDIPHDQGSSHGVNRIIRLAYYEHPSYVPLMRRAYELWREIESRVGEKLLYITGSIDAGPEDSLVFQGSHRSCLEHGLPHEVLLSHELSRRFPGYRLPDGHFALYQGEGGFLLSERCIVSYVMAAQALGAEVRAREKVLGWERRDGGIEVKTERGRYQADTLVVTAGPWASALMPSLANSAVPERQVLGWFQPLEPELFTPERFPVFNLLVDEGRYYGFPVFGVPGFKIGRYHHLEQQSDPDRLDRDVHSEDEEVLRIAVRRHFPAAGGPTMMLKTCMFTNSPDEHFIIGCHSDQANICFAAGFSGHGFKFCSVVGEILAELAMGGKTKHDIGLFDPRRFEGRKKELL
jgi:sarcosine oxidase